MEKIEHTESSAAAKVCQEMEKLEIIKSMMFLSAFEFLVGYFKELEANDFSVVKTTVQMGKKFEKLTFCLLLLPVLLNQSTSKPHERSTAQPTSKRFQLCKLIPTLY